MARALRLTLRLVTLVLSLSLVVFILVGSFWYVVQTARGRGPQTGYTVTVAKLEQAGLWLYLKYRGAEVTQPATPGDSTEVAFTIDWGESVGSVAYRLEEMGLVTDAELFRRVVQYHGLDRQIEAGAFVLRRDMTMEEIARTLQHGRVPSSYVTIPEGLRAEQVAALLEENGVTPASQFLKAVEMGRSDYAFLIDRPEGSPAHLEGFLYPDSYWLPKGSSPQSVLDVLLANWQQRVPQDLLDKVADSDRTIYEAVTLASIVEREAKTDDERPVIAGIYLNRLRDGMLLEADPTVQYAKATRANDGDWWPQLTADELRQIDSPYNTYLYPGLPPSPICTPGLASLQAVVEPAQTDYYYFLHGKDGGFYLARTMDEHLQNVARYR